MKFIHIADVHLGVTPDAGFKWSEKRAKEIWDSFGRIVGLAREQEADLLLIAGDLFHRQPLVRELKEVDYLFSTLTNTQVVLIAGNHDYLKDGSNYWNFPWSENVHFLYQQECESVFFPELNTRVYGLSYHTREITQPLYDELVPVKDGSCSILLAHGGDARHIPIDRRKLALAGFDYIALGHIHKPQVLIRDKMQYCGAIGALDRDDTGIHGHVEGIIENGKVRARFVPDEGREYKELDIRVDSGSTDLSVMQQISEKMELLGRKHFYKIRLAGFRDPDIIFNIKRYYELGQVADVRDETEPDYDFTVLEEEYRDGIIGEYIPQLKGDALMDHLDEITKKALYYGVQALLETKE